MIKKYDREKTNTVLVSNLLPFVTISGKCIKQRTKTGKKSNKTTEKINTIFSVVITL